MKNSTKLAALALAVAATTALASTEAHAKKEDHEKCYGISKAGQNDCASTGHSCAGKTHECATKPHSCAGMSGNDADRAEWVYTPTGLCEKIVGGSLKAGS